MGCCASNTDSDPGSKAVSKELAQAEKENRSLQKLLLLGAGGSGKSTLFKQLHTIHGGGFSGRERDGYRSQIYSQVIEAMQVLIRQCQNIASQGENKDDDDNEESLSNAVEVTEEDRKLYTIDESFNQSCSYLLALGTGCSDMDPTIGEHIANVWKCEGIQHMFENNRNKICVPDSTSFYFENIARLAEEEYIPTDEDLVLVRYRTTGMAEKCFTINNSKFQIVDVGGQRNERKKWIHHFDGVTAVIFVVSLTCYDEVPFEDVSDLGADLSKVNNMKESLDVFGTTLNSAIFANTGFILFLNKKDIMKEKIKTNNITSAFPDYTGEQEYKPSVDYIRDRFITQNKNPNREIFCHITCATDKANVQKVFDDVTHTVINWSLG